MAVARKAFLVVVFHFIFLFMTEQLYNLYMTHILQYMFEINLPCCCFI